MDELMISGRRYLSSLRAAKDHGYHSDYIGQLIRADKVKGQKVGRAWYVDADSLAIYLGKESIPHQSVEEIMPPEKEKAMTESVIEAPVIVEEKITPEVEVPREEMAVEASRETEVEKMTEGESDPEEHHIPIVKVDAAAKPRAEIFVEREKKESGLTYISDDTPLLPEIRKGQRISRPPATAVSRPVVSSEPEIVEHMPQNNFLKEGILIGTFAGATFLLVMALSTFFVLNISVGPTESASVSFSLPE